MDKETQIKKRAEERISVLNELPPEKQRLVQLYTSGNYTIKKIASVMQVNPATISRWLKEENVKKLIEEINETTHEMVSVQLKQASTKALERLFELMDSNIDGVALQAVKDVLDRTGHKAKHEIKIDKTVVSMEKKLTMLMDETLEGDFEDVE